MENFVVVRDGGSLLFAGVVFVEGKKSSQKGVLGGATGLIPIFSYRRMRLVSN